MDLRQVIDSLGLLQIALAGDAGVSRFKLYEFLNGAARLTDAEERSLLSVLKRHPDKAEKAIEIVRPVAHA
jgi:hypothetical protein